MLKRREANLHLLGLQGKVLWEERWELVKMEESLCSFYLTFPVPYFIPLDFVATGIE